MHERGKKRVMRMGTRKMRITIVGVMFYIYYKTVEISMR